MALSLLAVSMPTEPARNLQAANVGEAMLHLRMAWRLSGRRQEEEADLGLPVAWRPGIKSASWRLISSILN